MIRISFLLLLVGFSTVFSHAQSITKQAINPVKIGLLIPDKKSVAAKNGAEMAISEANRTGGMDGRLFELVVRSMEGPWGAGAKEAVNLIFKDEVCAIMGSTDGRNAHLVEQVTTKSHVIFLSVWAGDPTLSQAFVPWFYSCVPNNDQQATVLVEEIYSKQNSGTIGLISDQEYDSQSALRSFQEKAKMAGISNLKQFSLNGTVQDISNLINQLVQAELNGVVLLVKPANAVKIIEQIRLKKMNLDLFSTESILNDNDVSNLDMKVIESEVRVSSTQRIKSKQISFNEEFQKQFGIIPGPVATYAYDGMNLLIESIKKAGLEREKIQKAMSEIHYEGVTGLIQFDQKGNRSGSIILTSIKDGTPSILEK